MEPTLLAYYRSIEDSSARMLAAAKVQDWDEVVRCEGACAVLIEQLRYRAKSEALDEVSRAEKTKIMLRILHNDAQIRYLAEPWLTHLDGSFEGSKTLH